MCTAAVATLAAESVAALSAADLVSEHAAAIRVRATAAGKGGRFIQLQVRRRVEQ
jgi:hypothetical protein